MDITEIEDRIRKSIRFGRNSDEIITFITNTSKNSDPSIIKSMVTNVCDFYPNYDLIQKIMRSKIVINIIDMNEVYIVDLVQRSRESIKPEVLKSLFDPKFSVKHKEYVCRFTYEPSIPKVIYKDGDIWTFNTYIPPIWYENYFYSEGKVKIPKLNKIPEIYEKYLKFLVNDDLRSYDYILDWLANAIHRKNYCFLVTIGNQGIGKGVLGRIMEKVFGFDNYHEGKDQVFKKNFNSQLGFKKLFYCDEVTIKNKEQEDAIKVVVNDNIEIERKFKDVERIRNHVNLYISSNNLDAIRITADDRRFSIVNLTDKKLIEIMSDEEIKALFDDDNVDKLCQYLYYRDIDVDGMRKVFLTERTEQVREAVLSEWQDYFINDYCPSNAGKELKQTDVSDHIEDKFGTKYRPGRIALGSLRDLYPEKFNIKKKIIDGRRAWVVEFFGG